MKICDERKKTAVCVDRAFLDEYLAGAPGEFVKVYLALLRLAGEEGSAASLADYLQCAERDITRAVRYWEQKGVLRAAWDGEVLTALSLGASVPAPEAPAEKAASAPEASDPLPQAPAPEAEPEKPHTPLSALQDDKDFGDLMTVAGVYLKRELTRREAETFAYLYADLGMSEDLLEYLLGRCLDSGHTSVRYMEKVALSWHKKGIRTREEAKAGGSLYRREYYDVYKELGLKLGPDRNIAPAELESLKKWFDTYGMSPELVREACRRTVQATHTPSFAYVDRILSDWKELGITAVSEIPEKDRKREKKEETAGTGKAPAANRFRNFEERSTDLDAEMVRRLRREREKWESARSKGDA